METIIIIAVLAFTCWVVYIMSEARGRNAAGWTIAALLVSPLLVMLILLVIGKTEEKVDEEFQERFKRNQVTIVEKD